MQPDPLDPLYPIQSIQQLRQGSFLVDVQPIIGQLLGYEYELLNAFSSQALSLSDEGFYSCEMCLPRISGMAQNEQVLLQPSDILR